MIQVVITAANLDAEYKKYKSTVEEIQTMTAHTPDRWHRVPVFTANRKHSQQYIESEITGKRIAKVLTTGGDMYADAHLIAAAPRLLDACQDALSALDAHTDDENVKEYLRSVIAQATGTD